MAKLRKAIILTIALVTALLSGNYLHAEVSSGGTETTLVEKEKIALAAFLNNTPLAPIDYLLLIDPAGEVEKHKLEFESLISFLEKKKSAYKSDKQFLEFLFYKVHARLLKVYQPFTSFSAILSNGRYNCLTATALYALLFDHFDYEYEIVENAFHIYLTVQLEGKSILIESTDPIEGFIEDSKKLNERLNRYTTWTYSSNSYKFDSKVFEEIDLYQLVGLHYYNTAVAYYNDGLLAHAYRELNKAFIFHYTERMVEFMGLILNEADISPDYVGTEPAADEMLKWVISDNLYNN